MCGEGGRGGRGRGQTTLDYGTAPRSGTQFSLSRTELHWQRLSTATLCPICACQIPACPYDISSHEPLLVS